MAASLGSDVVELGSILDDAGLASRAAAAMGEAELRGWRQLASQAVLQGIDYATLGLGWDHPQSRAEYRAGSHASCARSAERRAASRAAIAAALERRTGEGDAPARGGVGAHLVAAFRGEIGVPGDAGALGAVLAALDGELVLPLRALNEDRRGRDTMAATFAGRALPAAKIHGVVDAVTERVLDGTFSDWRYSNAVGAEQLRGLSEDQIGLWRTPAASRAGELRVHEDAAGELGLFWATKIGGPSHGFDYEGQCLLPLLANARHKVILVSDPAYPHNACGRAHFRLLWTEAGAPVLWLETVNVDFNARVDARGYQAAVLGHAVKRADALKVALSLDPGLKRLLASLVDRGHIADRSDKLVLRPSNGVVEASDYLTDKHDWLQDTEEVTRPLRRVVYDPQANQDL